MKLFLATLVATICYVSAGKTQKLMAAMNAAMLNGMVAANPGMMAGGLNPRMVAGGGAGLTGQPLFVQFVPGVPAFAAPGPVPNMYPVPAVNPGIVGGAVPQQLPLQPDPLRRFRRQIMKQGKAMKTTVDTQIPAPTDTVTTTVCEEADHHRQNDSI
ncbi:hypothetical protein INR49_025773 [Caranx melampygus]|nr:hypothetical protein INR49_025773 [Caranx melampygus]